MKKIEKIVPGVIPDGAVGDPLEGLDVEVGLAVEGDGDSSPTLSFIGTSRERILFILGDILRPLGDYLERNKHSLTIQIGPLVKVYPEDKVQDGVAFVRTKLEAILKAVRDAEDGCLESPIQFTRNLFERIEILKTVVHGFVVRISNGGNGQALHSVRQRRRDRLVGKLEGDVSDIDILCADEREFEERQELSDRLAQFICYLKAIEQELVKIENLIKTVPDGKPYNELKSQVKYRLAELVVYMLVLVHRQYIDAIENILDSDAILNLTKTATVIFRKSRVEDIFGNKELLGSLRDCMLAIDNVAMDYKQLVETRHHLPPPSLKKWGNIALGLEDFSTRKGEEAA